jgi:hypothetical protein
MAEIRNSYRRIQVRCRNLALTHKTNCCSDYFPVLRASYQIGRLVQLKLEICLGHLNATTGGV